MTINPIGHNFPIIPTTQSPEEKIKGCISDALKSHPQFEEAFLLFTREVLNPLFPSHLPLMTSTRASAFPFADSFQVNFIHHECLPSPPTSIDEAIQLHDFYKGRDQVPTFFYDMLLYPFLLNSAPADQPEYAAQQLPELLAYLSTTGGDFAGVFNNAKLQPFLYFVLFIASNNDEHTEKLKSNFFRNQNSISPEKFAILASVFPLPAPVANQVPIDREYIISQIEDPLLKLDPDLNTAVTMLLDLTIKQRGVLIQDSNFAFIAPGLYTDSEGKFIRPPACVGDSAIFLRAVFDQRITMIPPLFFEMLIYPFVNDLKSSRLSMEKKLRPAFTDLHFNALVADFKKAANLNQILPDLLKQILPVLFEKFKISTFHYFALRIAFENPDNFERFFKNPFSRVATIHSKYHYYTLQTLCRDDKSEHVIECEHFIKSIYDPNILNFPFLTFCVQQLIMGSNKRFKFTGQGGLCEEYEQSEGSVALPKKLVVPVPTKVEHSQFLIEHGKKCEAIPYLYHEMVILPVMAHYSLSLPPVDLAEFEQSIREIRSSLTKQQNYYDLIAPLLHDPRKYFFCRYIFEQPDLLPDFNSVNPELFTFNAMKLIADCSHLMSEKITWIDDAKEVISMVEQPIDIKVVRGFTNAQKRWFFSHPRINPSYLMYSNALSNDNEFMEKFLRVDFSKKLQDPVQPKAKSLIALYHLNDYIEGRVEYFYIPETDDQGRSYNDPEYHPDDENRLKFRRYHSLKAMLQTPGFNLLYYTLHQLHKLNRGWPGSAFFDRLPITAGDKFDDCCKLLYDLRAYELSAEFLQRFNAPKVEVPSEPRHDLVLESTNYPIRDQVLLENRAVFFENDLFKGVFGEGFEVSFDEIPQSYENNDNIINRLWKCAVEGLPLADYTLHLKRQTTKDLLLYLMFRNDPVFSSAKEYFPFAAEDLFLQLLSREDILRLRNFYHNTLLDVIKEHLSYTRVIEILSRPNTAFFSSGIISFTDAQMTVLRAYVLFHTLDSFNAGQFARGYSLVEACKRRFGMEIDPLLNHILSTTYDGDSDMDFKPGDSYRTICNTRIETSLFYNLYKNGGYDLGSLIRYRYVSKERSKVAFIDKLFELLSIQSPIGKMLLAGSQMYEFDKIKGNQEEAYPGEWATIFTAIGHHDVFSNGETKTYGPKGLIRGPLQAIILSDKSTYEDFLRLQVEDVRRNAAAIPALVVKPGHSITLELTYERSSFKDIRPLMTAEPLFDLTQLSRINFKPIEHKKNPENAPVKRSSNRSRHRQAPNPVPPVQPMEVSASSSSAAPVTVPVIEVSSSPTPIQAQESDSLPMVIDAPLDIVSNPLPAHPVMHHAQPSAESVIHTELKRIEGESDEKFNLRYLEHAGKILAPFFNQENLKGLLLKNAGRWIIPREGFDSLLTLLKMLDSKHPYFPMVIKLLRLDRSWAKEFPRMPFVSLPNKKEEIVVDEELTKRQLNSIENGYLNAFIFLMEKAVHRLSTHPLETLEQLKDDSPGYRFMYVYRKQGDYFFLTPGRVSIKNGRLIGCAPDYSAGEKDKTPASFLENKLKDSLEIENGRIKITSEQMEKLCEILSRPNKRIPFILTAHHDETEKRVVTAEGESTTTTKALFATPQLLKRFGKGEEAQSLLEEVISKSVARIEVSVGTRRRRSIQDALMKFECVDTGLTSRLQKSESKKVENIPIHENLMPYQRDAVEKLLKLWDGKVRGGMLCADMGLGKSMMMASCLFHMLAKEKEDDINNVGQILVLATASTNIQLANEFKRWFAHHKINLLKQRAANPYLGMGEYNYLKSCHSILKNDVQKLNISDPAKAELLKDWQEITFPPKPVTGSMNYIPNLKKDWMLDLNLEGLTGDLDDLEKGKQRRVVICTVESVRNKVEVIQNSNVFAVFVDEAQKINNPKSLGYKAVNDIIKDVYKKHKDTGFCLLATGTPIENGIDDVVHLIKLFSSQLDDKNSADNPTFGLSGIYNSLEVVKAQAFKYLIATLQMASIEGNTTQEFEEAREKTFEMLWLYFRVSSSFRYFIDQVMVHITRTDEKVISDWKGRIPNKVDVELTAPIVPQSVQKLKLEKAERKYKEGRMQFLSFMKKSQRIIFHPERKKKGARQSMKNWTEKQCREYISQSALLTKLFESGGELDTAINEKKQTIIFVNHLQDGKIVRRLIRQIYGKGKFGFLRGDKTMEKRNKMQTEFTSGNQKILISTTEAGGVGVSYNNGEVEILLDESYVPAHTRQIESRAIRSGSKVKNVRVVKLKSGTLYEEHRDYIVKGKKEVEEYYLGGARPTKEKWQEEFFKLVQMMINGQDFEDYDSIKGPILEKYGMEVMPFIQTKLKEFLMTAFRLKESEYLEQLSKINPRDKKIDKPEKPKGLLGKRPVVSQSGALMQPSQEALLKRVQLDAVQSSRSGAPVQPSQESLLRRAMPLNAATRFVGDPTRLIPVQASSLPVPRVVVPTQPAPKRVLPQPVKHEKKQAMDTSYVAPCLLEKYRLKDVDGDRSAALQAAKLLCRGADPMKQYSAEDSVQIKVTPHTFRNEPIPGKAIEKTCKNKLLIQLLKDRYAVRIYNNDGTYRFFSLNGVKPSATRIIRLLRVGKKNYKVLAQQIG